MGGATWEPDLGSWVGGDFQALPRNDGGVALCGACARTNQCRLGITQEQLRSDDVLTSNLACPPDHEGGPSVAHGGWTAAVMDEMLGHVPIAHNQLTVTATLTVNFKKPVPIERPLQARAWIDKIEGQKWFVSGELVLLPGEAVLATATGIWIARDFAHFDRHRAWLTEQDAAAEQST